MVWPCDGCDGFGRKKDGSDEYCMCLRGYIAKSYNSGLDTNGCDDDSCIPCSETCLDRMHYYDTSSPLYVPININIQDIYTQMHADMQDEIVEFSTDERHAKDLLTLTDILKTPPHEKHHCNCTDVANIICTKCNGSGYSSTTPIEYCTCLRGLHYGYDWKDGTELMEQYYPDSEYVVCVYEHNTCVLNQDWLFLLPFSKVYGQE